MGFYILDGNFDIQKDLPYSWSIRANVAQTLDYSWRILLNVANALDYSWQIKVIVSNALAYSWIIQNNVLNSLDYSWQILSALNGKVYRTFNFNKRTTVFHSSGNETTSNDKLKSRYRDGGL